MKGDYAQIEPMRPFRSRTLQGPPASADIALLSRGDAAVALPTKNAAAMLIPLMTTP